jgi:hypothetical protein
MPNPDVSPRAAYASAVVAAQVEDAPDPKAALAAVRVLGPDVFAPALLAGRTFEPADARAVADSFRIFPPDPGVGRDWTTVRLLARFGDPLGASPGGPSGDAPEDTLGVPEPAAFEEAADPGGPDGPVPSWRARSLRLAGLHPLALPDVDGPVHEAALRRLRDLSRGTSRAMLRRDYPTAARQARRLLDQSERPGGPTA